MKKNKIVLVSAAALMAVAPLMILATQTNKVQAAGTSVKKTIMHTAIGYDENGRNSGIKLYPYKVINVDQIPVQINDQQYYKVTGKYLYIKPTNIDGVTRKITHNAYIYRTSTQRTPYGMTASSKKWKFYKGETVTTYGGSYKFRNGKRYFRVGGPRKQYIKSYNLGPVIKSNTTSESTKVNGSYAKETTVTVHARSTYKKTAPIFTFDENTTAENKAVIVKRVANGTKFTVDRLEYGKRADMVAAKIASFNGNQAIYHIKGTNNWIYSIDVDPEKQMLEQYYKY